MSASLRSPMIPALCLLLPGLAFAADKVTTTEITYEMKVGTEMETGKVVKIGAKTVFLTCPGGKTYDIDQSLTMTWKKCPELTGSFGSFTGKLLDFDVANGSYMVMTKDGETKSLSTAPFMLRDFAKGQDLWVAIDKSPKSTPYALTPYGVDGVQ
jgi:hypothetical protein